MKWLFAMVAVLTVSVASAQASKERLKEIWSYADSRLDQQMDVWFQAGQFPAAIQVLRVTTALRPGDYDAWTNLGWMLENVEDWDGALEVYKEYRQENPKDPDGSLPLGEYYFRRKKYALVPSVLEPSIHANGRAHPNVYRLLAHAYERTGKLADAERVWKAYLALAPQDGAAKHNLDRVEHKLAAPQKP